MCVALWWFSLVFLLIAFFPGADVPVREFVGDCLRERERDWGLVLDTGSCKEVDLPSLSWLA
jgi:hypothetical protein